MQGIKWFLFQRIHDIFRQKGEREARGEKNERAIRDLSIETFFTCKKRVDCTNAVLSPKVRNEGS